MYTVQEVPAADIREVQEPAEDTFDEEKPKDEEELHPGVPKLSRLDRLLFELEIDAAVNTRVKEWDFDSVSKDEEQSD